MIIRAALILVLLALFVVARRMYLQWRAGLHHEARTVPRLPSALLDGAERVFIVFTTPMCATCGPVTERLRAHDPGARVITVDATEHPSLARSFHVRAAPTVLLADGSGDVRHRMVGAAAVTQFIAART